MTTTPHTDGSHKPDGSPKQPHWNESSIGCDCHPTDGSLDDLKEKLAAIEHERWSDWQQWVHAVYANKTQPFEKAIENWKRQIATPYADLSDREKASDMEQVDRYWPLIEAYTAAQVQQGILEAILSWEKLDQMGKMLYLKEAADTIVNDVQGLVAEIEALQSKGEL